jgi:translation elongation factor EF-Ts
VLSCFVEDLEQKRVAKLMSLSGMTEMRARKALKRHGTVEAALDRLMKRGGAKKKKKKKKSTTKSVEEEVPNAAFFLANVKCSRCKVFIAVELVESHECGQ